VKAGRFPWILSVLLCGCSTTSCPKSAGPASTTDAGAPVDAGPEVAEPADAAPVEPPPVVEDDKTRKILQRLNRSRRGGRKSVTYREPTRVEELAHAAWVREAMAAAIEGKPPPTTAPKGFKLVDMKGVWVLRELRNTRRGAGTLVLRPGTARPILVEAPHTFFDHGTLPVALAVFEAQKARALMINTAHRNLARDAAKPTADKKQQASTAAAKRDDDDEEKDDKDSDEGDEGGDDLLDDEAGTGDDDEDAKNPSPSDVAHAEHSFFLAAHKAMLGTLPNAVTVQIHGFHDDKVPSVGVVVSAAKTTADATALAARLKRALPDHPVRVHPTDVKVLGGTTNVEARASRDVAAPFFHLELSGTLRKQLSTDTAFRARFAMALDPIFMAPAPSRP
jgi:hypothetical protein